MIKYFFKMTGFFHMLSLAYLIGTYLYANSLKQSVFKVIVIFFILNSIVFTGYFKFPEYSSKIKNILAKDILKFFLVFLSISILIIFGYSVLFFSVNLPPGSNFNEKINIDESVFMTKNHNIVFEMIKDFYVKYEFKNINDYKNTESQKLKKKLIQSKNSRDKIIKFIMYEPFNLSVLPCFETYAIHFDLNELIKLELVYIDLIIKEDYKEGIKRYNDLWKLMEIMIKKRPNSLYNIVNDTTGELVEIYFKNREIIREEDIYLFDDKNFLKNYDKYYKETLKLAYYVQKHPDLLLESSSPDRNDGYKRYDFYKEIGWPLWDKHKTFKVYHDYYLKKINRINKPYYTWSNERLENELIFINIGIVNPVGKIHINLTRVEQYPINHADSGYRHFLTKSKYIYFEYIINDNSSKDTLPVNPLTGKRYDADELAPLILDKL